MIYSFNMAPNHIAVINQQGSYLDNSGIILFTPGRPAMEIKLHFSAICAADLRPYLLSACFGSRKCLWIRYHAAFVIYCVLQHVTQLCPFMNSTHPPTPNVARWAPTVQCEPSLNDLSDFCLQWHVSWSSRGTVIGFSSRDAAQIPPLSQLFTLSTAQIVAAPAHISLLFA